MKIGIIGAGQVGSALSRKLSAVGHTVFLANSRGPETIRQIADETGASAVTVAAAVEGVDLVIIAVPERNVAVLPEKLFDCVSADVVIVDAGNYSPSLSEGPIVEIEGGTPESQWVSQQLGRPVVKAFNTILADSLSAKGKAAGMEGRIAIPVAGDEPRPKQIVIDLIGSIGFEGVDAGTIAESWRQQPGTPACCSDLEADDLRRALSRADKARAPELLALIFEKMGQLSPSFTGDDLVNINRSVHGL